MTNPLEGQPRRFIGIARVPIIRRAAEYYQGFVTPWRLHPFHHEIADKNGFEKFLMQPNSTEGLKNRLLESTSFTEKERARVKKALNLATVIHAGQMREDKVTPHLNHVLRLALRDTILREEQQTRAENPQATQIIEHPISILDILTDLLHDSEEDIQDIYHVPQADFKAAFFQYFNSTAPDPEDLTETPTEPEPQIDDLYENIHAMNKFKEDGTKLSDEEYHRGISARKLWRIKAGDRKDSLIGDISQAMRHKRAKAKLKRIIKSAGKAEKIIPDMLESDPSLQSTADDLMLVIEYARLFCRDKT